MNKELFDNILRESYADDVATWKDACKVAGDAMKDARNADREYKNSALRHAIDNLDDIDDNLSSKMSGMNNWAKKESENGIPGAVASLIKYLTIAAPELVLGLIRGTITIASLPVYIKDAKVKELVQNIKLEAVDLDEKANKARHSMKKSYQKEFTKFEAGEKVKVEIGNSRKVATLVKKMSGDRWQVQFLDGTKRTVPTDDIYPYEDELDYRKKNFELE